MNLPAGTWLVIGTVKAAINNGGSSEIAIYSAGVLQDKSRTCGMNPGATIGGMAIQTAPIVLTLTATTQVSLGGFSNGWTPTSTDQGQGLFALRQDANCQTLLFKNGVLLGRVANTTVAQCNGTTDYLQIFAATTITNLTIGTAAYFQCFRIMG